MEALMGGLLRSGVLLSAAVVVIGALVYLKVQGHVQAHYNVFRGEPAALRSVSGIVKDTISWDGAAIIQLGLLFLIATPVARVVFSVFAFGVQRDWLYVFVSAVVLVILAFSLSGLRL